MTNQTNTIANTPADPTLERSTITIDDKAYDLCFDLASLAAVEDKFLKQGHDVNLLVALPQLTLSTALMSSNRSQTSCAG